MEMLKIKFMLLMMIIFLMVSQLMILMSNLLSKKNKLNYEKMSPFESGFNPKYMKRMPLNLRFFLITIIFLIFDVEIALLMPSITSLIISNFKYWLLMSISFLMTLILGLIYEWNYGALNWM